MRGGGQVLHKYTTKSGDTFDMIAHQQMGSTNYTEQLMNSNRDKLEHFIFSAGETILIPDIAEEKTLSLPPWRKT